MRFGQYIPVRFLFGFCGIALLLGHVAPTMWRPTVAAPVAAAAHQALPQGRILHVPADGQHLQDLPGNFPFQSVTSADGLIIVHYYDRAASFPTQVIQALQGYLKDPIGQTLGYGLLRPVNVYLYNSRQDFLSATNPGNAAEVGAFAIPEKSEIYAPLTNVNSSDAVQFLPHELTHIVFHQHVDKGALQGQFHFFPLWLDEGLASYDEQDSDVQSYFATQVSTAAGDKAVADLLTRFNTNYPSDVATDDLCYAEAWSFINYLVKTYGLDALHQFLNQISDGELWQAAHLTFGADPTKLMSDWRVSLGLTATVQDLNYSPTVVPLQPYVPGTLGPQALALSAPLSANSSRAGFIIVLAVILAMAVIMLSLGRDGWRHLPRHAPAPLVGAPLAPPPTNMYWSSPPALYPGAYGAPPYPYSPPPPYFQPPPPPLVSGTTPPVSGAIPSPLVDPNPTMPRPDRQSAPVVALPGPEKAQGLAAPTTKLPNVGWWDVALGLGIPLLMLVNLTAVYRLDSYHSWASSLLLGALPIAALGTVLLIIRQSVVRGFSLGRWAALALVTLLGIGSAVGARPALQSQAKGYAQEGAFTLALRATSDAGGSASDLAHIDDQWAQAALGVNDLQTSVDEAEQAIEAAPNAVRRHFLTTLIDNWTNQLIKAQDFYDATGDLQQVMASPACDANCHQAAKADAAQVLLAQANLFLTRSDQKDALAQFTLLTQQYPNTPAATTANGYLNAQMASMQAEKDLQTALATTDVTQRNTKLQAIVTTYPYLLAASQAQLAPQPVTGQIRDASGASVGGQRIFFVAFAAQTSAYASNFNQRLFAVAATADATGHFSVLLQASYWYAIIWEDPSLTGQDFNSPINNQSFNVQAFTPQSLGTITGD